MEKTVIDSFKGKYAFLDNDFPCFIYHDGMRFPPATVHITLPRALMCAIVSAVCWRRTA